MKKIITAVLIILFVFGCVDVVSTWYKETLGPELPKQFITYNK